MKRGGGGRRAGRRSSEEGRKGSRMGIPGGWQVGFMKRMEERIRLKMVREGRFVDMNLR
jgi:hypothetical protein